MESQKPIPSPTRPNDWREVPGRGRKRPGHFDDLSPSEVERRRQEVEASIEKSHTEYEAESARRQALSPKERLREDGDQLRQKIEADPEMIVVLEMSRSQRARCRANNDCAYAQARASSGNTITTSYRIRVDGVDNIDWFGKTKHYYHLLCFERMVDLKGLLREKFKMGGPYGRWGLMVEDWFKHSGRIDVDKIAAFLEEYAAYEEKHGDWSKEYIDWSLNHTRNCKDKEPECKCPAQPQPPKKPELGDHTTKDGDVCTLSDVLKHPLALERPDIWWAGWHENHPD